MSAPKKNAYGNATSDTARRTWDADEYTQKAKVRAAARRDEYEARQEAAAAGRKYYHKTLDPSTAKTTESRASRLDVAAHVGKTQLVPAGAGVGKRGRSAGFYCADCDLTFKDNLQFVEHLNSKQHLVNVGESGEVRRATLEEVRERIAWLAEKRRREKEEEEIGAGGDLQGRLARVAEEEERKREDRRRKRREKRRKTEGGVGTMIEEERGGIIC